MILSRVEACPPARKKRAARVVFCLAFAAGDRRVYQLTAVLSGGAVEFFNPLHGDRTRFHQNGSRSSVDQGLAAPRPHVAADGDIGQHTDHYLRFFGCGAGGLRHLSSAVGQGLCFVWGAIPDAKWVACVEQTARHA